MSIILVAYDLDTNHGTDPKGLSEKLEGYKNSVRIQKSVWLIDTEIEPVDVYSNLSYELDLRFDRIIVAPIPSNSISKNLENNGDKWINEGVFDLDEIAGTEVANHLHKQGHRKAIPKNQ